MTIKLSCLFFYRRVFDPSQRMKRLIEGGILVIFLTYIALFFSTVFECTPIRKSWNPLLPGHCLKPRGLPYASGAINVASDIYVLILPIPCIWDLNMNITRKLRILSLFSLGILYPYPQISMSKSTVLTIFSVSALQALFGLVKRTSCMMDRSIRLGIFPRFQYGRKSIAATRREILVSPC